MLAAVLLIATAPPQTADGALARFEKFVAAHPSISIEFEMALNKWPNRAKGKLVLKRPNFQRFVVALGTQGFELRQNPSGVLELDTIGKNYELYDPTPGFAFSASQVSGLAEYAYPAVFVIGSISKLAGEKPKFTFIGTESIRGSKSDHVSFKGVSQQSEYKLDAYIDLQGRLQRLRTETTAMGNTVVQLYDFLKYDTQTISNLAQFAPLPPIGTTPLTVDTRPYPLQIGESAPANIGQIGVSLGGSIPAKQNGPRLIVFYYSDCEIAPLLGPFASKLASLMKQNGGDFVEVISAANSTQPQKALDGSIAVWDKSGKIERLLKPQGSPMFYLTSKSGVVEGLWLGFEPEKGESFLKAINARLEAIR